MKKTIFIAGAGGYIGSKLIPSLLKKGYKVLALDRYFFGDIFDDQKQNQNLKIIKADIRSFNKNLLKDVYCVINLAALSNDPSADLDLSLTRSINYSGAVRLAKLAKKMDVKKCIFSSSCSIYGAADGIVTEQSKPKPISEYARSKLKAEEEILKLADENFCVVIPRFATLYGLSEKRMRFDLLVNIMTLHSWKNRKIFILGGGKQWRPLMHVDDAVNFIQTIIKIEGEETSKINRQIINVGSNEQNIQVYQVANLFRKFFSDLTIEETPDDPDHRSYQVNFNKSKQLVNFKHTKTIESGILEIKQALEKGIIVDDIKTITVKYYKNLIEVDNNILSKNSLKRKVF